jgi:hypothetical protein
VKRFSIFLSTAAVAALLASCASVPRDAGPTDVQQAVVARTSQTLEWTASDDRVRAMLQDDLTADEAVAMAIANNPRLQVTLAELGIAREQAKLDLARSERQLLVAREALLRAIGLRDASVEWRVPGSFPELPAAERDQQQLEQLAAQQRLDLSIARREVEVARLTPGTMVMGAAGMGDMAEHQQMMAVPRNSIPMRGGAGPYGPIDMGGMFTVIKIRDQMDYTRDPGWYQQPHGTSAYRVDSMPTTPPPPAREGHGK